MLRPALFIAAKDLQYVLRERETLIWTFLMPIVFFYFIGTVTAGFGGGGGARETIAVEAPSDAGFLAGHVALRLERQGFDVARLGPGAEPARYSRRLVLPAGLTASVLSGTPATLHFHGRGEGPAVEFDKLRVQRAAYGVLADVLLMRLTPGEEGPEAFAAAAARPRPLTLEVRPAGERLRVPTGFEQAIPGTMVLFTMMLLLTSGAVSLMVERRLGLLRRMASAPVARSAVVAGKWGGRMALAVVQLAFAIGVGTVLFGMDWGPSLPMVLVVLFCWAGLCASLGLLLGSLARSEGQAIGLAVPGTLALAALGGCWWPIEVTPAWMQTLALFLPTGWTMDALHRLVSFRHDATTALPHALALAATALAIGALAVRKFRFD